MSREDPISHISRAYPDRVEVRGRDLAGDLMGRLSFSEYFHLLLTGREPTDDQRFFLDLLLVSIAEHGMMPTNVAARMTLAADPGSLQGAVAAGILGAGPVVLGTSEECARLLEEAVASGREPLEIAQAIHAAGDKVPGFGHPVHRPLDPRAERILELADERGVSGPHVQFAKALRDAVATGHEPAAVAGEIAHRIRAARGKLPGFGHPVHRPLDPRAERILELADARGVSGPNVTLARALRDGAAEAWGRPLTMNVAMPIAAVMLDLGFPPAAVKAVPILARTAGLLAHLAEEQQQPIGFLMAAHAEEAISYERPDDEAP